MDTIKLARGLPPISIMRKIEKDILNSVNEVSKLDENSFLQYSNFNGYEPLRDIIAEKFSVNRKRVFITNGSMDGLHHFILFLKSKNLITDYICGKQVYDRPIAIAKRLGFNMHSVALETDGLNTKDLESVLKQGNKNIIYSIPWYDNPSGILHSDENIKTVAELAKIYNSFVVRDGAYIDLSYYKKINLLPIDDNVIQTFSFSKVISASFHVGGVIIPEEFCDEFSYFLSSWRLSPILINQMVAFDLFKKGIVQNHLENEIIPDGQKRVRFFNDLMDKFLPDSKTIDIQGGHFWGGKIQGLNENNWDDFVEIAEKENGLSIPHHSGFMPLEKDSAGYIRIPIFLERENEPYNILLEKVITGIKKSRDSVC